MIPQEQLTSRHPCPREQGHPSWLGLSSAQLRDPTLVQHPAWAIGYTLSGMSVSPQPSMTPVLPSTPKFSHSARDS